MWFTDATLGQLRHFVPGGTVSQTAAELRDKRAAEEAVETSGVGTCLFCGEEIVKNETLALWESELLLSYCPEGRSHWHKPCVKYSVNEGVVIAERNDTPDTESIPSDGQHD